MSEESEARILGHGACSAGYSKSDNPYEFASRLYIAWLNGWHAAKFESKEQDNA